MSHPLTSTDEVTIVTSASDSRDDHVPVGGNPPNHSLAYAGASNGPGSSILPGGAMLSRSFSESKLVLLALSITAPAL